MKSSVLVSRASGTAARLSGLATVFFHTNQASPILWLGGLENSFVFLLFDTSNVLCIAASQTTSDLKAGPGQVVWTDSAQTAYIASSFIAEVHLALPKKQEKSNIKG